MFIVHWFRSSLLSGGVVRLCCAEWSKQQGCRSGTSATRVNRLTAPSYYRIDTAHFGVLGCFSTSPDHIILKTVTKSCFETVHVEERDSLKSAFRGPRHLVHGALQRKRGSLIFGGARDQPHESALTATSFTPPSLSTFTAGYALRDIAQNGGHAPQYTLCGGR